MRPAKIDGFSRGTRLLGAECHSAASALLTLRRSMSGPASRNLQERAGGDTMQVHDHPTPTGDRRSPRGGWDLTPGSHMPFLKRYGMDEAERRRRTAFLGITEADAV